MKRLFFSLLFFSFSTGIRAQPVYSIPWAYQQPKFVFPIYFEEGGGQKDTLYLGFDSIATGFGVANTYDDSAFGVKKVLVDTNLFYVCWTSELLKSFTPPILKDSVYKSNVSPLNGSMGGPQFPGIYDIRMNNGVLPLKISWDKNLFYNDSLPFNSNPPAPIGQGRFSITFSNDEIESENGNVICQFWPYILVADTSVNSICTARDSMTIFNVLSLSIPVKYGVFTFYISAWSGVNTGINITNTQVLQSLIYPNPFYDNFTITLDNEHIFKSIKILDLLGNLVYVSSINSNNNEILGGNLRQGVYFIELISKNEIFREKIIKQ